ncbi:MAG: hypothetical protein KJ767_01455 [Nanoarchaeota archaeon]|nr:hypothetical protein [Nanoarchaeota archaeon]
MSKEIKTQTQEKISELERELLNFYGDSIHNAIAEIDNCKRDAIYVNSLDGFTYFLKKPSESESIFHYDTHINRSSIVSYGSGVSCSFPMSSFLNFINTNLPEAYNIYYQLYPNSKK